MGESSNKKNEKDVKTLLSSIFKIIMIFIIVILFLWSIRLFYIIPKLVRESNQYKEFIIEKVGLKDWIPYYGAALGAILGGVITGGGLFITLRINAKELRKQRKIDNERWENSNRQFNQQMKIQIINEKINDYKRCVESIDELINANKEVYDALVDYKNSLGLFVEKLEDKLSEVINNGETSSVDVFNFDNINRSVNNSVYKLEIICANMSCITEEYIKENLTKFITDYEKMAKYYSEIRNFNTRNKFTNIYEDYLKNNMKLYETFSEERYNLGMIYHESFEALTNIEKNFSSLKDDIRDEIVILYNQKYNLDK